MTIPNDPRSPHIGSLCDELARSKPEARRAVWRQVSEQGKPLIEAIPNADRHVLVTFLWRGTAETRNMVMMGGVAEEEVAAGLLRTR
jgi:hypothetical protein